MQKFLFDCVKLTGLLASTVNLESSNPCAGPSPRIKISFPLLSRCADELISASKIIAFFPMLRPGNENAEREFNPMS